MTQVHARTLALLGADGVRPERSVNTLIDWGKKNGITLPAAFVEWAKVDDGDLLGKYSNVDWFEFDEPELVVTPDGVRGLRFNIENQGNFDRIVTLDHGDDPPVLFAWIGRPPWVTNTERFSDAVYAQVFDWQYWLEFRPDDPKWREITYYGAIDLGTDHCLVILRQQYEEVVTTRFVVEGAHYAEYRFLVAPKLRLTVVVAEDRSTAVRITGRPIEAVSALEAELRSTCRAKDSD